MVLRGYSVAVVTYWAKKMTMTCSPMIMHLFDTIIVISTDKGWQSSSIIVKVIETVVSHLKFLYKAKQKKYTVGGCENVLLLGE